MSAIGYFFDRWVTIGLMFLTFAAIGFSFPRDVTLRRGEKISAIPDEDGVIASPALAYCLDALHTGRYGTHPPPQGDP